MPKLHRIYAMDCMGLTQEQIAVSFARASRSPEPFDEIAGQVSEESAKRFHEQWVIGYGHSSVAEHAVVHLAVENFSRLAVDELENNRLASCTEKSSRYQVIEAGDYQVPEEVQLAGPESQTNYESSCLSIFTGYRELVASLAGASRKSHPQRKGESKTAWEYRLRRTAADAARNVLPAATLTNLGVTVNARTLEYAVSKLMSSDLRERRALGAMLRDHGRMVVPTLIKYADCNPYLAKSAMGARPSMGDGASLKADAALIRHDPDAVKNLATAILFRKLGVSHAYASRMTERNTPQENAAIVKESLDGIGPHDALPREFETVQYLIEFVMDYGALREFRRHRMMTPLSQPLTVSHSYQAPEPVASSGIERQFNQVIAQAESLYASLATLSPNVAQYAVTHAHFQRILVSLNLRQLRHLIRLRTSQNAHPSVKAPVRKALETVRSADPALFEVL